MTKKLLSIIVLFVFSATVFSQTDSIPKKKWIVKWDFTATADVFSFPTVQFAVEKKLNDIFSLQTEFGVQLYDLNTPKDSVFVKTGGFKFNVEGRIYPFKYYKTDKTVKSPRDGWFTGLQLFYRQNKYNELDGYGILDNDTIASNNTRIVDYYGVTKKIYGANLVFGYQRPFFRHFVFETYIHVGVMDRQIRNISREPENPRRDPDDNYDPYGVHFEKESQSGIAGNFALGIKFGYQF